MADQKDRHVAGRPEEPEPTGPAGTDPVTAAEGAGPRQAGEAGAAPREATAPEAAGSGPVAPEPETAPSAAHHSVPPGPPPGGYHGAPPVPGGPGTPPPSGMRERARSRPVQLLIAGVVGAIIGGGAVGLIDVLDDGGPERTRVHMVRYGSGTPDDGFGHWHGRMHGDGPMMPGDQGQERWRGTRPWPAPSWAPDEPAPAPPPTPSAPPTP